MQSILICNICLELFPWCIARLISCIREQYPVMHNRKFKVLWYDWVFGGKVCQLEGNSPFLYMKTYNRIGEFDPFQHFFQPLAVHCCSFTWVAGLDKSPVISLLLDLALVLSLKNLWESSSEMSKIGVDSDQLVNHHWLYSLSQWNWSISISHI